MENLARFAFASLFAFPEQEQKLLIDSLIWGFKDSDRKIYETALETVLLVLEAVTGQNAISQAKEFVRAADATGIILTKLDGTAKGGSVISVKRSLGIPVRFIGVGEGMDDLMPFDAEAFADTLVSLQEEEQ